MEPRKDDFGRGRPIGGELRERKVQNVEQVRNDFVVLKLRAYFDDRAQVVLQCPHLDLGHGEARPLESRFTNMRTEQPFGDNLRPDLERLAASSGVGNAKAAVKGI